MRAFSLNENVFLWYNQEYGVFYNCETYKHLIIPISLSIRRFCERITVLDNLYTIDIKEEDSDELLESLLNSLVHDGFGRFQRTEEPVRVLPPILRIESNWEQVMLENRSESAEILKYLSSITIFWGGNKDNNCYYLQTEYPIFGEERMTRDMLSKILKKTRGSHISKVKIVVPADISPNCIEAILNDVAEYGKIVKLYILYNSKNHKYWGDAKNEIIYLHAIGNHDFKTIEDLPKDCSHRFLVTSDAEIKEIKQSKALLFPNAEFVPVYNGFNKDFIICSLFPTQKEVLDNQYKKQMIFIHQAINTFSFGHLFFTPNGLVYSDLQKASIGSYEDSFYDLILNELNNNYSWRRVRRVGECNKCPLVDLCPPPTVIESVMNINCVCKNNYLIKKSQAL